MDCSRYRALYEAGSGRTLGPSDQDGWDDHECEACDAWALGFLVERRGVDVERYPCVHMAYHVTHTCSHGHSVHECPDNVVVYDETCDEYGLSIKDGGSAVLGITHCPWCGVGLPASKRDRRARELEALGVDPDSDDVPAAYRSAAWWRDADA